MKPESQLTFSFETHTEAAALGSVLRPEIKSDSRVKTMLEIKDSQLLLTINATDRNAFRSTVNSYARWIRLYEDIGGIE
ncbi:MAG TPA: hypothetical protein ENH13_04985 [Euryarchaeota archaeon]|nr:transcription factor Pcc1 [archaeon BMS3Abin16]GBE56640.1 transcription factor Pcc1 [archaeon BMS3Bbin16]HDH28468.1 hypothetical protein [Euryarchaeota archaeon]HDY73652.1 hypothetical protein [Euryarchaeota archaeon]